jgi:hypothetical protein
MTKIFTSAIVLVSLNIVAQNSGNSFTRDSIIVTYSKNQKVLNAPALYLNDKLVTVNFLDGISPDLIEHINTVKGNFTIDGIEYSGKLYVKTKESYNLNIVSLQEIEQQYVNFQDQYVVFQIDGKIVTVEKSKSFVDKNFILQIDVTETEIKQHGKNLVVINVILKTKENLEKNIILRGDN